MRSLAAAVLTALAATVGAAGNGLMPPGSNAGPALGHALTPDALAAVDRTVYPDGTHLPDGRGSVSEGQAIYERACVSCHGAEGQGAYADGLAGGEMGLTGEYPDKVVGTYWPHATTLFDFIARAMPMTAPKSLSADEVYAVTAYLLFLNDLLPESGVLDAAALAAFRMPNEDGFIWVEAPTAKP